MNHWNHLKHHHHLNVGYIRGPSDAAGLTEPLQPGTKAVLGMAAMGGLIGGLYGVLTGSQYQILPIKAPIFGAAVGAAFQIYKQGGFSPSTSGK